jgi:hypothetical protein
MVLNPFFYESTMDLFDELILTVLNDGKPRVLAQLLGEVDFSRARWAGMAWAQDFNSNWFKP